MKNMLIIAACGHKEEPQEIEGMKNIAELHDIKVTMASAIDNQELEDALKHKIKFDYIYLSSHGDECSFFHHTEELNMGWNIFGTYLCDANILNKGGILLLSCCRGGLNEVAYSMFYKCEKIEYIVGPRQNLCSAEMIVGYHILLFNIEERNIDPIVGCNKILNGTDIRFKCFDRLETISTLAYLNKKEELDAGV